MILRNSYFDLSLVLDKIRKNAWIITLYSVVLFFSMPVFLSIRLQGIENHIMENREIILSQLVKTFFAIDNKFVTFLAIPAAVIAGATVFFYINSKKQVDFFHSLPLRREKLFVTNYCAGVVFFLIPYTAGLLLSVVILGVMGYISYLSPGVLVSGYLFNMLLYMVIYSITIFAMILCGNLVVSLLGTTVFLIYGPILSIAYLELMRFFYKNFYSQLYDINSLLRNSSPTFDFMMVGRNYTFSPLRITLYILLAALLTGISMYLYNKRPSEAAGRAIAFKVSQPVLKYPIVFLATLISGVFFSSVGGDRISWMIFGFISGGVLSHFIIEIIYSFDFKAIFKNIKGLCIFGVLFAIFISVPMFDMTGYDRKLPEISDIKNVKVSIMNFNQNSYFMNMNNVEWYGFMNRERTLLDRLNLSEKSSIEAALEIARMGVSNTGEDRALYDATFGVEFELKNGSRIARRYNYLKNSQIEPYIISIYDTEEFKQKFYSLYSIDSRDVSQITIQDLYSRNGMDTSGQITGPDKILSLVDALRADILEHKGQAMKSETPFILVNLIKGDPKVKIEWEVRVPVYPSYAHTMAIINALGIKNPEMIPAEMVDFIMVNNYEYEKYMATTHAEARTAEFGVPAGINEVKITDKREIEEVLESIVPESAVSYNPFFEKEYAYRVNVVSSKYQNGYSESFVFMKNRVPEFIKGKFPQPGKE